LKHTDTAYTFTISEGAMLRQRLIKRCYIGINRGYELLMVPSSLYRWYKDEH